MCKREWCTVPVRHRHQPPSAAMVAESIQTYRITHLPTCDWRKDVYDGCSCGVTQKVDDLFAMGAVVLEEHHDRP